MMKNIFRYLFLLVFLLLGNVVSAQFEGPDEGTNPPPPESVGSQATPIDMYEGLLLVVAVMFIVGIYYYNKRRKLA
ncbi:hypothetical protein ACFFUE_06970 [Bergeyella porcorum]|uniref:hypothetical protein n=1 Tax=Bergeyella porcorum TaxID=1735111 RepID=UPI0035EE3065